MIDTVAPVTPVADANVATAIPDTSPLDRVNEIVAGLREKLAGNPSDQTTFFAIMLWDRLSSGFERTIEIAAKLKKPDGPSAAELKKLRDESTDPEIVELREKLLKIETLRIETLRAMNQKLTGIVVEEVSEAEAEVLKAEYAKKRAFVKESISTFKKLSENVGDATGVALAEAAEEALPALRGPGSGAATGGSGGTPKKRFASITLSNGDTAKNMTDLVQKLAKLKVKTTVQDLYNLAESHGNTFPVAENLSVTVVEKS